ncbi:MAG: glycosyltransferase family 9 protein [Gammaproteobacteria bacterium]
MAHDLLIKLPNWVGDVCMCLPALDALRARGVSLTCVGHAWAPNLLKAFPATVISLPKGIRNDAKVLRSLAPRDILLFTDSFSSAAAARLAGKKAIGYVGDWRQSLLAHRVRRGTGQHVIERFWWLATAAAKRLGLDVSAFTGGIPYPRLPLTDESRRVAAELLSGGAGHTIVICPIGHNIKGQSKRWPGFSHAADLLADRGWRLVCCPGPDEEQECRRAAPRAEMLPGLDLQTYGAVLAAARGVLANDCGPMHLAAAVGGEVLGVYGISDPQRYRPWGGHTIGCANRWPKPDRVVERLLEAIDPSPSQPSDTGLE